MIRFEDTEENYEKIFQIILYLPISSILFCINMSIIGSQIELTDFWNTLFHASNIWYNIGLGVFYVFIIVTMIKEPVYLIFLGGILLTLLGIVGVYADILQGNRLMFYHFSSPIEQPMFWIFLVLSSCFAFYGFYSEEYYEIEIEEDIREWIEKEKKEENVDDYTDD